MVDKITKTDQSLFLRIAMMPEKNANMPDRAADKNGMVKYGLLKNVAPPR